MRDDALLVPKHGDNYSDYHVNTTLNRLGFREQLQGIFTSETVERKTCWCTKAILWEFKAIFLCKHICFRGLCGYKICAQKSRPAKPVKLNISSFDLFSKN